MKILFITDNFPPEVNAPATRTFEHCKEWKKLGAEITIITCAPNFPQGQVYKGYKNKFYQKEFVEGIKVIRVWSYITANKGFTKRILDYISFAVTSFLIGLFVKTDIIIATSPQFFTVVSGYLLSIFKRKPWVFEVRDLWPESIKAVSVMKNDVLVFKLLEKLEIFLYKKASLIIVVTESFKENIANRGINENKIKIIKNGANVDLFYKRDKNLKILKELNLTDKFIVGYIGTHGLAHKLDFIIDSIAKITDDSLHFLFIGDGAVKNDVMNIASQKNLKNVTFLNPIPKDQVAEYLSITDVSLVPLKKSNTFAKVIPSKIFEVSCMQRPILLGVEGESKRLIEEFNAGVFFEPENEKDFLEKTILIKNDKALYSNLQKGCGKLASFYDRKKLANDMFELLKSIKK